MYSMLQHLNAQNSVSETRHKLTYNYVMFLKWGNYRLEKIMKILLPCGSINFWCTIFITLVGSDAFNTSISSKVFTSSLRAAQVSGRACTTETRHSLVPLFSKEHYWWPHIHLRLTTGATLGAPKINVNKEEVMLMQSSQWNWERSK